MLSTVGNAVRPRVTFMPAWSRAELSDPARARLRVTEADCAVFQAAKGWAEPAQATTRTGGRRNRFQLRAGLRQAWARRGWRSPRACGSRVASDSRVVTTWMPRAASRERSLTLRARVRAFPLAGARRRRVVAAMCGIEHDDKAG